MEVIDQKVFEEYLLNEIQQRIEEEGEKKIKENDEESSLQSEMVNLEEDQSTEPNTSYITSIVTSEVNHSTSLSSEPSEESDSLKEVGLESALKDYLLVKDKLVSLITIKHDLEKTKKMNRLIAEQIGQHLNICEDMGVSLEEFTTFSSQTHYTATLRYIKDEIREGETNYLCCFDHYSKLVSETIDQLTKKIEEYKEALMAVSDKMVDHRNLFKKIITKELEVYVDDGKTYKIPLLEVNKDHDLRVPGNHYSIRISLMLNEPIIELSILYKSGLRGRDLIKAYNEQPPTKPTLGDLLYLIKNRNEFLNHLLDALKYYQDIDHECISRQGEELVTLRKVFKDTNKEKVTKNLNMFIKTIVRIFG